MRDFIWLDKYYSELMGDIYAQPPDKWHEGETDAVIYRMIANINCSSVLDVGCGEGEAQSTFVKLGITYLGIAVGNDAVRAKKLGRNVIDGDFNFLVDYQNDSFDLVFSRHSLEHSPFPILTLMEWHRVSSKWLCLVMPNPQHFTFTGRNHYSVAYPKQTVWWLRRAGWRLVEAHFNEKEFQYLCMKMPRISYEGWAEVPLPSRIYEFERDKLGDYENVEERRKDKVFRALKAKEKGSDAISIRGL